MKKQPPLARNGKPCVWPPLSVALNRGGTWEGEEHGESFQLVEFGLFLFAGFYNRLIRA